MDFNELFEIKDKSIPNNAPENLEENIVKHILIRIGILLLGIGLLFLLPILDNSSNALLGSIYLSAIFLAIWLIFMIIETVVLYVKRKNNSANSNLIIVITLVLTILVLLEKVM